MEVPVRRKPIFKPLVIIVLLLVSLIIWTKVFEVGATKDLEVTFFDVGQGDAALISFPNGQTVLIDGGPDRKILEKVGRVVPFYRKKIDLVFLSHPHADHLAGLNYILESYGVGRVVMPEISHNTPEFQEFEKLLIEKGVPITDAKVGSKFIAGGIELEIVYQKNDSENLNRSSAVVALNYGDTNFLFTGDIESDQLESVVLGREYQVIKVPHHGSADAFSEKAYEEDGLEGLVIPVGENKYGHPSAEILKLCQEKKCLTTEEGDIIFRTDGRRITISNRDED